MSYNYQQWKARIASRSDITSMVTHLTKPSCNAKNLNEEKIKELLPETEHWRIVNFNILANNSNVVDWSHEREWRLPNNMEFECKLAHVVLYDSKCWDFFIKNCPQEIFQEIHGVTVLKSIIM